MNSDPTIIGITADPERTQALSSPGEVTQMGTPVACPVCRSHNLASEVYCSECGFLLGSAVSISTEADPVAPPVAVLSDTRTNQQYPLQPGKYSVGRENTDILLTDSSVSRSHAEIEIRNAEVIVTDLGSTNGTIVSGQRLSANQPSVMHNGQDVRFGNCVMTLAMDTPANCDIEREDESSNECSTNDAEESQDKSRDDDTVSKCEMSDDSPVVDEPSSTERSAEAQPVPTDTDDIPAATSLTGSTEAPAIEAGAYLEEKGNPSVRYAIGEDGANIGRRETNDIVMPNSYVSSSHAQIACQNGTYILTDVGSTNGTALNGRKMEPNDPRIIDPGDEISFGPLTYIFKINES